MKGQGFVIHNALTSTLDGLDGDARAYVLGAAYSKARGRNDFKLPKKYAYLAFLVEGIATESSALNAPVMRTPKSQPLTGAERAARHRAKLRNESNESNDSNESNESNAVKEGRNKGIKECGAHVTFVTDEELSVAAHNLGIPHDFVFGYFKPEMEKLEWLARGANGSMFRVNAVNLASVLRGWWTQENRKKNPARPPTANTGDALPSIMDGDMIS